MWEDNVTLRVRVWIETWVTHPGRSVLSVTLLVRVWIETDQEIQYS